MEEPLANSSDQSQAGWKAFPFISGAVMGVNLVFTGVLSNLVVYLIQQYNIGRIKASQIVNLVNGCSSILPFVGTVVSDSGLGCFPVITAGSVLCFLGMLLFSFTSSVQWLRPAACSSATTCDAATDGQLLVLYTALVLAAMGIGGVRCNGSTMGANQFSNARDQATFFNWFFVMLYISTIAGLTVVVYIQDNAGWTWGYSLCAAIAAFSTCLFLSGRRYYQHISPQENSLLHGFQAVISAVKHRNWAEPSSVYDQLEDGSTKECDRMVVTSNDQEEEEEEGPENLKAIFRVLPIVSTTIILCISTSVQSSMTTLQALVMDRRLGPHFLIPAGSINVFVLAAAALFMALLDRIAYPAWQRLTDFTPTPIHRIAMGHVVNVLAMAACAMSEWIRLKNTNIELNSNSNEPLSVLWLVPAMILVGLAEAFNFPGLVAFCYQEFPASLRSTATGVVSLMSGIGFYLSAMVIVMVKRISGWLKDDLNQSRLDYFYWSLVVAGLLNFGYFLLCAKLYSNAAV